MQTAGIDPQECLPLKPADFQVLMALMAGKLHGYGIMKEVERQSDGAVRLEVGSMYRLLGRMISQGLIEEAEAPSEDSPPPSGRRRYFGITKLGRLAARAEARRLRAALKTARARSLLDDAEGADV